MNKTISGQLRPAKKWYFVPLFLFLLSPLISAYLLYSLFAAPKHMATFSIPGTTQIYITQTGQYTLWTAISKTYDNKKFVNDLKDTTITFRNLEVGDSLIFVPKIGWRDSHHHTTHYSLGTLKFNRVGNYQINANSHTSTPYQVYLRQPSFFKIVKVFAISFLIIYLSIVSSILFAIIILMKRLNARNDMDPNEQKPTSPQQPQPSSSQETTWAMVCHLSGFAGFLFPLANIIAPLLIWGFKRQESPYLDDQGKEAINFQISITIYYVIAVILILIVIGLLILPLIAAFQIIAMIIASVESAHGKLFRYPLSIRFVR